MGNKEHTGTGTREWSDHSHNIQIGCENDCHYCFAASNAARFQQRPRAEWAREEFTSKVNSRSFRKREGVIMFPTSHDITPFNVEQYIRIAKLMLEAGNQLLIVTKPRMDCVHKLVVELLPRWQGQMLLRCTIGTLNYDTSTKWEPNAPKPIERLLALRDAKISGFETSVSIEPMLGSVHDAASVIEEVRDNVTETIWVGKMNQLRQRIDPKYTAMIEEVEAAQADHNIMALWERYQNDPIIRWKDSIKKVLVAHGVRI